MERENKHALTRAAICWTLTSSKRYLLLLLASLLSVSLSPRVLELLPLLPLPEVLLLLLLEVLLDVLLPPPPLLLLLLLLLPAPRSPSPTTSVRALMSSASFPDSLLLLLAGLGTPKHAVIGIGSEVCQRYRMVRIRCPPFPLMFYAP